MGRLVCEPPHLTDVHLRFQARLGVLEQHRDVSVFLADLLDHKPAQGPVAYLDPATQQQLVRLAQPQRLAALGA
jgi:hypothetical protein